MKTKYLSHSKQILFLFLICLTCIPNASIHAYSANPSIDQQNYKEYKGLVVDNISNTKLEAATITLKGTNISTVTNGEGKFSIKVPSENTENWLVVSYLGYKTKEVELSSFKNDELKIGLEPTVTQLNEINIGPRDARALIRAVLEKKGENYIDDKTIMTAFYRETIKKRRTYVSLSEAVIDVYKDSYVSGKSDAIKLYKARKSADYKKLDTLTVKLQGGPSSTLYIDVMKNSEMLFTPELLDVYDFSFGNSTRINEKYVLVIDFKQKSGITEPFYYGQLYIDAETLAMTKAVFQLNMENEEEVSKMFVRKKPSKAEVTMNEAAYTIHYRQKDGKWYYGYGKIDLAVKVNWKKKWFNSLYKLNVEMAITDWRKNSNNEILKPKEKLKSSVVLSDAASGFSDPQFWGQYNVIEPEKSIESAIKKIQKQLQKVN